jgi:hypothetical protein
MTDEMPDEGLDEQQRQEKVAACKRVVIVQEEIRAELGRFKKEIVDLVTGDRYSDNERRGLIRWLADLIKYSSNTLEEALPLRFDRALLDDEVPF